MTGRLRRQEPRPEEGSSGPVGVKDQGPEPRGGVEREADSGATVSLNIIRPTGSEQDSKRTALH